MNTEYSTFDPKSIPSLVLSVDNHSGFYTITPAIAQEIVDNLMYEKQRPLSMYRLKEFTNAMTAGTFAPVSTLIFVVNGKGFSCVDGQHTLQSVIKSGKSLTLPVLIIKGDQDKVYSKIDRGKPRTLADSITSNGIPKKMGVTKAIAVKSASAIRTILNDYHLSSTSDPISDETIFLMLDEYKREIQRCFIMLDHLELGRRLSGKTPLTMLLTLYKYLDEKEWEKVDQYIYGAATDDLLKLGDPRKWVYIMYSTTLRTGRPYGAKPRLSTRDELAILLRTWESFYNGEEIKQKLRYNQIEKILAQTPNLAGTEKTLIA